MSVTKRIAFGAAASWFSRGVTIVLGLVLMPVLFRHLPKEELGVWLLLGQSWAAMGILDLGFGVTLTRRIALAKGKSGADPNAALTPETLREIADLVAAGRRIYRFMALGVFIVSWALGFFYLRNLELQGLSHATVWIAWTILCACQALTVWATVWTCLLQGVGYIGWDALIASFISAGMLIAQIIVVLCGGGLIALAAIAAVTVVFQRAMTRWFARRRRPELFSLKGKWNRTLVRGMAGIAFRAWLTAVGTVLVFNTDQFFITAAKGTESIPAFRAAYVLIHNITVLAVSLGLASTVFISHFWQAGNMRQVHRIVERNTRLGLLVMLCSCAFVITTGQALFNLWLGPGNFVGYRVLTVFLVYETLEAQSYIVSTSSRATDDEAFGLSSLLAGVLKIFLATFLIRIYGLLGLALATLLALLFTNHWYMLFRGLTRLQLPFSAYAKDVILPASLWSIAALVLAGAMAQVLKDGPDLVKVLSGAATVGIVFVLALARLVLSHHERARVRHKCSAFFTRLLPAR
ncbi:MAG TPA: lipopolysaccharide biosynthesis protein [Candidatus Limnocylindria bacterium]|nr:lipopolysaccharide biosynthesis protein [Candidatus Limnocylindria bacterium]